MVYRDDIEPHYAQWIEEGMQRYREHKAMAVGIKLVNLLLSFEVPPNSIRYKSDAALANICKLIRDHEIDPKAILSRVAQFYAFMEARPDTFRSKRAELYALARVVCGLLPWTGSGRGARMVGALTLARLGDALEDHLGAWARAFVKRLHSDIAEKRELLAQSAEWA